MLAKVLPTVPRFLTLPSIGLDISDTSLKYIEVSTPDRGGSREIMQWGSINIPEGVLQRGDVADIPKLVSVLRECKKRTNAQFVRVSLPEERAYLFETEIRRNTPRRSIRNLLEFRLAENVPLPVREVGFDYTLLPPVSSKDRHIQTAVTAYNKDIIQTYYDACIDAGLQPVAFEVETQAMARACIPAGTTGATMIVDFGKTRTGVGVVYQDVLLYTSTIEIGGDDLSDVLLKQMDNDTPEAVITEIKNTQGLVQAVEPTGVRKALLPTLSNISDELKTIMQYWHVSSNANPDRRLSQVVLCGGSANLRGLPEYLTQNLEIPVSRANVWEHAVSFSSTVPDIDFTQSLGYATAVGLALGNFDV